VKAAVAATKKIGLDDPAGQLDAAYKNTLELIRRVPNSKKPANPELMAFLKPAVDAIGAMDTMRYKGKNTKKFKDHYTAIYEAVMSCSWVTMAPPQGLPKQHVESQSGSVDFSINRVCKSNKDDDTKAWKAAMQAMNKRLCEFVKEYFKSSGLTYNAKGGALSEAAAAKGATPAAEEKKEDKKPAKKAKKASPGGGMAAVMGDLSKGLAVTKGMKKVTSDMKTKNRKDRVGKVTVKKAAPKKKRKKFGPAQTKFMGGRWMVENYEEDAGLIVCDKANLKSNVFISMCDGCTVQVPGKVKAVTIDNCVKVRVFVQDVVSTVEMVNCKSVMVVVQKDGKVPSFAVDKCESAHIILSRSAYEAHPDIYSSNVTAMNIEVPGPTDDDDNKEHPVPEQFITKIDPKTGKVTTKPTEH
jgi:adenylyl cyclase-associated protein